MTEQTGRTHELIISVMTHIYSWPVDLTLPDIDILALVRGSAGALKGLGPARAAGGAELCLDVTWCSHLSDVTAVWTTWYLAARCVMAWCSLCTAATMSSADSSDDPGNEIFFF